MDRQYQFAAFRYSHWGPHAWRLGMPVLVVLNQWQVTANDLLFAS